MAIFGNLLLFEVVTDICRQLWGGHHSLCAEFNKDGRGIYHCIPGCAHATDLRRGVNSVSAMQHEVRDHSLSKFCNVQRTWERWSLILCWVGSTDIEMYELHLWTCRVFCLFLKDQRSIKEHIQQNKKPSLAGSFLKLHF